MAEAQTSSNTEPGNLDALRIARPANGAPKPVKRKRRWGLITAVGVGILVALGVFASNGKRAQPVDMGNVTLAYPSQTLTLLNATGRVVAQRRAAVSSKATGRLEALNVLEGQAVKSGEIVARIESRDVGATREQAVANVRLAEANLEQGMAELTNAEVELKRQQDLAKQNFVSQSAVDAAQARALKARATISSLKASIGVAQANYKVAEVNFEQTLIRAPFDGVILTKNANVGDIITPFSAAAGTTGAVVNIADMSTLEVEADVSEASIGKISVGQAAEIQLDAFTELRLAGKVSRVVPTVDRSKATLLVKVTFVDHDARVLPDMSAKVAFLQRPLTPEERKPLVAVRPAAIVKRGDRDVVFVVQKGEAPKADAPVADAVETVMSRPVTSGAKIGDLVQVTGVAAGDKVVLSPGDKIADGVAVTQLKK
jgi:RND family efflux transporter MFP subunit